MILTQRVWAQRTCLEVIKNYGEIGNICGDKASCYDNKQHPDFRHHQKPFCACNKGYGGRPPYCKKIICTYDSDCTENQYCDTTSGQCQHVCESNCRFVGAICEPGRNHRKFCSCPQGMTVNREKEKCEFGTATMDICASNAEKYNYNGTLKCLCSDYFDANPLDDCGKRLSAPPLVQSVAVGLILGIQTTTSTTPFSWNLDKFPRSTYYYNKRSKPFVDGQHFWSV